MFVWTIFVYRKKSNFIYPIEYLKTLFYEISLIGIPEILLNYLNCYGFFQEDNPTVVLNFRIKLVSYYLSKRFVILGKYSRSLNNTPTRFKQRIHIVYMHSGKLCYDLQ